MSTNNRKNEKNFDSDVVCETFAQYACNGWGVAIELLERLARSQQLEVVGLLELFGEQSALLQTPLGKLLDPVRLVDRMTYALPVLLKLSVLELLRSELL